MLESEAIRERFRQQWNSAAKNWAKRHRNQIQSPMHKVTDCILKMSQFKRGQRVLDIACGAGEPAFMIASQVGPEGHVLGLDIAQNMIEESIAYARDNRIDNVEFRTIESELELGVSPESIDVCTCRHGFMFMPDPVSAAKSLWKVLRPHGRITLSTWGRPEQSPAFTYLNEVIARHMDATTETRNRHEGPGMFALPTPETLETILTAAGFQQIEVDKFDCPMMIADNPEAMWKQLSERTEQILHDIPEEKQNAIHQDFVDGLIRDFPDSKVVLHAEALVASGIKPS